jgi:hypothetical protein
VYDEKEELQTINFEIDIRGERDHQGFEGCRFIFK